MKRYFFPAILAILTFATSCQKKATDIERLAAEEGISLELAQLRKRTISDVHYDITFHIPAERDSVISGHEVITFMLDSLYDVPLDFKTGHIILPADTLHLGLNEIHLDFEAGSQSLNRREDYLYSLFVPDRAHTVFPCMDQPNLKGKFTLTLDVPADWQAVSNTYAKEEIQLNEDRKEIHFAETEPLSTYLFAFAAGHFSHEQYTDPKNGRTIGAYFRETDAKRLAQLPDIFKEVCFALDWLEEYTAIPYPFAKYDLVILPGFQFGGMEHTGATFYNDNTLFLPAQPTLNEILSRSQLITHETAHMWFGDLVTMDWFNDVWTKEVFANYFAAAITEPMYPQVNHELSWLSGYQTQALIEDRTDGRTAIQQPLDNLKNAGLIYNNIIYNKAPLVMRKMVDLMGAEAFQRGIRRYLKDFSYGNATWDDLIHILDSETSVDLASFSEVWVKQKGMPVIVYDNNGDYKQYDITNYATGSEPTDKWQQNWKDSIMPNGQILPNADGRGYGFYTFADPSQLSGLLSCWQSTSGVTRQSLLMTLYENYLAGKISHLDWIQNLIDGLIKENDVQTASTLISYMNEPLLCLYYQAQISADNQQEISKLEEIESNLLSLVSSHALTAVRTQLLRLLSSRATTENVVTALYNEWEDAKNPLLSVNDWMTLSYELAIRYPDKAEEILSKQRSRIDNPDRLRQFDFVSQAVVADESSRDAFFKQLISDADSRRTEPWARQALYYLNHQCRQGHAVSYIYPALEVLPDIQRTGDIFFPGHWCSNLLANHRSEAAHNEVQRFVGEHQDMNTLLKNKILRVRF